MNYSFSYFQDKFNESLRKISVLESRRDKSSSTSQQIKMVENMKAALKKANEENDNLMDRLLNEGNSIYKFAHCMYSLY